MKKGINAWAFPGSVRACEAMRYAKNAGYEAIELNLADQGEIGLDTPATSLKKLAAAARRIGVEISSVSTGLYWAFNLASDDAAERAKAGEVLSKQLDTAKALGCDAILVIPGSVMVAFDLSKPKVDPDAAWDRALAGIKAAVPKAEDLGVTICIENVWNTFLLSATEMRDFVDACGSPRVAAYYDPANIVKYGLPDQWARALGNRIQRVHFKDFRRNVANLDGFVHLLDGDVNYPTLMQAFKAVGYDGYVTAEIFPPAHGLWESQIWTTSKAMDFILGRVKPARL
ncbi:MAG TPA: sugar phosphate isomerase/epimerase family protein [Planctomycetota bacterium]|nr:sugar phosphate isomerase/epimerase family protein [Planctomycetota bacterium]HRR80524.1 sugar phosphate isomerase/epimerase family protein [Planctomycetota bacterium]HRT96493.1 sugar phosphate isomerase/epimerase family protein [Planctomycetota bacterium]